MLTETNMEFNRKYFWKEATFATIETLKCYKRFLYNVSRIIQISFVSFIVNKHLRGKSKLFSSHASYSDNVGIYV